MIVLVAVTFVLSWTPFYAVSTVTQLQTDSFLRHSQFLFTMLATHWAGFCSSAANPLIYAAMNYQFRRSFEQVRRAELSLQVCCESARILLQRVRSHSFSVNSRSSTRLTYSLTHFDVGFNSLSFDR